MLFKNNIPLTEKVEAAGNGRKALDWIDGKTRFVAPFDITNGAFGNMSFSTDFQKNGQGTSFALKGSRPLANIKATLVPKLDNGDFTRYYLIKFSNKKVLVCTIPYEPSTDTSTIPAENIAAVVGAESEDLQYVYAVFQGAGGGGAGGSSLAAGDGGSGGGYILCAIKLEHEPLDGERFPANNTELRVGFGGNGSTNRGDGFQGLGAGIDITSGKAIMASGGAGAFAGDTPENRIEGLEGIVYVIHQERGYKGTSGFNTRTIPAFTTPLLGFSDEVNSTISYQEHKGEGNISGAGAPTHFGEGASGRDAASRNGYDGPHEGTGGGGGTLKPASSTKGGKGGPGLIQIFY